MRADVEPLILQVLTQGSPPPTSALTRVYALLRPQGSILPAVTFERISVVATSSLAGDSDLDLVRVQIDCWGNTFAEAKTLANEVRDAMALASLSGTLKSRVDNGFDDYLNETQTYRSSQDYICWRK